MISIKNDEGKDIITYTATKSYQTAVICSNRLKKGGFYSIYVNNTKMYDVTICDNISNLGNGRGMGNGMGGHGGMMKPRR